MGYLRIDGKFPSPEADSAAPLASMRERPPNAVSSFLPFASGFGGCAVAESVVSKTSPNKLSLNSTAMSFHEDF
jgi:hypothetical protein